MIKLYYIQGISESDTLYPGIDAYNYRELENRVVKTFSDGFYPPYLKNEIQLSITDNTPFNYLSLDFNNVTYYYFIEGIEYINETDIKLHVKMDTYMTFFYRLVIMKGSILERCFINRFYTDSDNNVKINRNYIRENITNGDFILTEKTGKKPEDAYYENISQGTGNIRGWFVFKLSDMPNTDWGKLTDKGLLPVTNATTIKIINKERTYKSNQFVYFLAPDIVGVSGDTPITINFEGYEYGPNATPSLVNPNNPMSEGFNLERTMHFLSRIATCVQAYYIVGNPFSARICHYDSTTNKLYVESSIVNVASCFSTAEAYWTGAKSYAIVFKDDIEEDTSYFELNLSSYYNTSYGNITQLLDENYIRITWGNSNVQSSISLYKLDTIYDPQLGMVLDANYFSSLTDGITYYWLRPWPYDENKYKPLYLDDPYGTMVTTPSVELELINNKWAEYTNANRLKLIGSGISSMIALGASFATSGISTARTASKVAYNTGEMFNAYFMPDTVKNYGGLLDAIYTNSLQPTISIYKVNDFDYCASYFQLNGYLVNRVLTGEVGLMDPTIRNRKYFNIVKTKNTIIRIQSIYVSDDIKKDLISRLENGIRIWNLTVDNNTYQIGANAFRDNTERNP